MIRQRVSIVIIKNMSLLLVRGNEDYFFTPGGKVEQDESDKDAIVRECREELGIEVSDPKLYLSYESVNQTTKEKQRVRCYMVEEYSGEFTPSREIKEIFWYKSQNYKKNEPKVAKSIYKFLIPALVKHDLI
ncbi:NUDIX hydrolase [Patescibacteria group bacterium]|nr:NUDIX hydrolase [Patescibacteria group bacterium]